MNYDGPSFYKKRESSGQDEKNQEIETPLDRLKKEQKIRSRLREEKLNKQEKKVTSSETHYFRSTQIPKSLQNREGWRKEPWSQELVRELEKRLTNNPADYLLFSDNPIKEVIEASTIVSKRKKINDNSTEAMRIRKMVTEIESTLDTAALVQKGIETDLKKPNTGIHQTLSNVIVEDKIGLKNKKKK